MASISHELNDIQAIVRGMPREMAFARFLYIRVNNANNGKLFLEWLGTPTSIRAITDPEPELKWNIGFTSSGLENLDVSQDILDTFPSEFRQGMAYRAEDNGDIGASRPAEWDPYWTGRGVDIWIGLYTGTSAADLQVRAQEIADEITSRGLDLEIVGEQEASRFYLGENDNVYIDDPSTQPRVPDNYKMIMEHFGFNDAVTTPAIEGIWDKHNPTPSETRVLGNGKFEDGEWKPLAAGEFVLGHSDEVDEIPLAPEPRLISHNATFMVLRKLEQHVTEFREYCTAMTTNLLAGSVVTADYVAQKIVGRHRDGSNFIDPDRINNFLFERDKEGHRCPLGAHIRRANPRDSLGFETLLTNRHRIARRAYSYGQPLWENAATPDEERGLIFIAINASIARQFEFIQREWINFGNDLDQGDDRDPVVGNNDGSDASRMVIPSHEGHFPGNEPSMVCAKLPRFVDTRGGDYFFMPGIRAVRALADGLFGKPDNQIDTIQSMLLYRRNTMPDRIALANASDQGSFTYRQLDEYANQCANALNSSPVLFPSDDVNPRIAFLGQNLLQYFTLMLGAMKINAVIVPISYRLNKEAITEIIIDSTAKVVVVAHDLLGLVEASVAPERKIIVIGGQQDSDYVDFNEWIQDQPVTLEPIVSSPDTTCMQLYTSGTTGSPKGVELTHANLFALVRGLELMGISEESSSLVCMPMYHISGNGWAVANLLVGAKNILLKELDLTDLASLKSAILTHSVTHTVFVPTVLYFMVNNPDFSPGDFRGVQAVLHGGSPMPPPVFEKAAQLFDSAGFYGTYGLTESTGGVTRLDPKDHLDPELLLSCGQASHGHEIRIVHSESCQELAEQELGEIWIRGPQVMKGYWNDESLTREKITSDGWLRTADIGYRKGVYIFIHDRLDDMILSGGEKIYPVEIERVLAAHPAVTDVAVIGVPDERWGEAVKALVCRRDQNVTESELQDFCKERLASFKVPGSIEWKTEALPRNAIGKILKSRLREPYWKDHKKRVS